jgi:hypothetical protein
MPSFEPRAFGSTPLSTSALGLGSSYGLPARDVERAYEAGVDFFLWGSRRRSDFGEGLRNIATKDRSGMVIAIQSYSRFASLLEWSVGTGHSARSVPTTSIS